MASSPRIDELRKKFDENPRRYFAPLANEYRKTGELEKAVELCRQHLPQNPGNLSGHIVFGQALFESRVFDEARTAFETALGLDPENLIALRHLGDIARETGDVMTARAWYQRVLDVDPRNDDIAAQLANLNAAGAAPAVEAAAPAGADDATGWGDINPEKSEPPAAEASPAAPAAQAPDASQATTAVRPSVRAPTPAVTRAVPTPSSVPPVAPPRPASPTPRSSTAIPTPPFTRASMTPGSSDLIDEPMALPDPATMRRGPATGDDFAIEKTGEFDAESFARGDTDALPAPLPDSDGSSLFGDENYTPPVGAATGDDLGLEVMEFVPPERPGASAPVDTGEYNLKHDPSLGNIPSEISTAKDTPTPAAFVTETMAELYLQQGFRDEALNVYRQLMAQNPGDPNLRERVAQLESGSRSSIAFVAVSDEIAEAAEARQKARPSRSIRAFFGRIAARRAPPRPEAPPEAAYAEEAAGEAAPSYEEPPHETAFAGHAEPAMTPEGATEAAMTSVADLSAEAELTSVDEMTMVSGESVAVEEPQPVAEAAPSPPSVAPGPTLERQSGSVNSLFGGGVSGDDDRAAENLSRAFSGGGAAPTTASSTPTGSGRAARVASTELSLDHVFRETPRTSRAQRGSASFSFDQFFADGGGESSTEAGAGGAAGSDAPRESQSADIEQFNAWLEGLKKK